MVRNQTCRNRNAFTLDVRLGTGLAITVALFACSSSARQDSAEPNVAVSEVDSEPRRTPTFTLFENRTWFEHQSQVSVAELIDALSALVEPASAQKPVRDDYEDLLASHQLQAGDMDYLDYVRVRIAFEATRDGGFWRTKWAITNKEPTSKNIWRQFAKADDSTRVTAVAECDELSALFAFVAFRLGVRDIGLYWPTPGHAVAVWVVGGGEPKHRIVVPTSQIYLSPSEGLGTTEFDTSRQARIWEYRTEDVPGDFELPAGLARMFVSATSRNVAKPAADLQVERNRRSRRVGGS